MSIKRLQHELYELYTKDNFHKIAILLIESYKINGIDPYKKIIHSLKDIKTFSNLSDRVVFLALIKFFHPDKLKTHLQRIGTLKKNSDKKELLEYKEIIIPFLTGEFENIDRATSFYEEDLEEIFEAFDISYGYTEEDFDQIKTREQLLSQDHDDGFSEEDDDQDVDVDVIDAVKSSFYGNLELNLLPGHLLDLVGSLELCDWEINNLNGIEYCLGIEKLDLSFNLIRDITRLKDLTNLKELYLSNNLVEDVSVLKELEELEILDLSNNQISDLSPLYDLTKLKFLNVSGNQIRAIDITHLSKLNITILS